MGKTFLFVILTAFALSSIPALALAEGGSVTCSGGVLWASTGSHYITELNADSPEAAVLKVLNQYRETQPSSAMDCDFVSRVQKEARKFAGNAELSDLLKTVILDIIDVNSSLTMEQIMDVLVNMTGSKK